MPGISPPTLVPLLLCTQRSFRRITEPNGADLTVPPERSLAVAAAGFHRELPADQLKGSNHRRHHAVGAAEPFLLVTRRHLPRNMPRRTLSPFPDVGCYFRLRFLRKRTPDPPPFSSMNSIPAASIARCNFPRASSDTRGPNPASRRLTVGSDRPARAASSD
jgi:hypothetical protein